MTKVDNIQAALGQIICGDCLDVMRDWPDNFADAIVTDPPYELGFMGKKWDASGIAHNVDVWSESLRVLKPGGYLLAFGGTRTYHRMACAIEDAGFEIRDMIEYCYGSGFPKSLNIGKAVDKLQGNEREDLGENPNCWEAKNNSILGGGKGIQNTGIDKNLTKGTSEWEGWGTALKPAHEPICMARKPLAEKTVAENVLKYGTGGINIDESRVGGEATPINKLKNWSGFGQEIKPEYEATINTSGRFPANLIHDNSEEVRECFPESKSTSNPRHNKERKSGSMSGGALGANVGYGFDDSGNASRFFKSIPAHEPICMARKPLAKKTVAENVLKYGTGGINIDESRVEYTSEKDKKEGQSARPSKTSNANEYALNHGGLEGMDRSDRSDITGRFPANLIHDNSEEVRECFPETGASNKRPPTAQPKSGNIYGKYTDFGYERGHEDNGGNASRFFKSIIYQAKASKAERNKGCEGLDEKQYSHDGRDKEIENAYQRNKSVSQNNHPTVKPIALMEYLIKMVSRDGRTVFDPFCGSGTTCVAAKMLGRRYIGIDISEEYCEIARKRLEAVQTGVPVKEAAKGQMVLFAADNE